MTLCITNCILANITNMIGGTLPLTADYNAFYQASSYGYHIAPTVSSSPFQTVGAANFYLGQGGAYCPYRGAGTTNINAGLLGDLRTQTTYPPVVYAQTQMPMNTTLFPQAQRDTGLPYPDLGYHYPAVDYALGYVWLTNGSLTVSPGTVIANFGTNYGDYGFGLTGGTSLFCQGSPTALVRWVAYDAVQEEALSGWKQPSYALITDNFGMGAPTALNCRFTDFSSLGQNCYQLFLVASAANFQDSQFHGGLIEGDNRTINFTNCLFERVVCGLDPTDSLQPVFRNNLYYGGELDYYPSQTNSIVRDNLFDQAAIYTGFSTTSDYIGGFNASVTGFNQFGPPYPTDLVLSSSPAYQAGPLGKYYRLSSSVLFNGDTNTTAAQVGLYHYTTITNMVANLEIKETNSWLDIGYHYVAVDNNTNPIDSDAGGAPDYLENTAGDGRTNNVNETNWQNPSDDWNYLLLPQYLRCEYRVDPWGITTNYGPPRLFWIVTSPQRADKQVAYQIQVATSTNNLDAGFGDMWDSGQIYSDQTIQLEYNGQPLASNQRLWWHVRTWDLHTGLASGWSTNAFFQVGSLNTADWNGAYWIGVNGYQHANACPMFRSPIILLTNHISAATAYVSGKGVYELWVNGYKIGPNLLAPEWTDYNTTIQYQTFDLTPYLTNGSPYSSNVIGAFTAEGWCYGDTDITNYYGPPNPSFLLHLYILNADGTTTNLYTDSTWRCSTNGPIRSASIYGGDNYDATREGGSTNWCTSSYTPVSFTAPMQTTSLTDVGRLCSQPDRPIQITQVLQPANHWKATNSNNEAVTVFDFGQNIAGWCTLALSNLSNCSGSMLRLRHGEVLELAAPNNAVTGNIYRQNLGGRGVYTEPPADAEVDTFILNSNVAQVLRPHFTYHGFRYVEFYTTNLSINTSNMSISACVLGSGLPIVGGFSCSGSNPADANANWVLTNNLINKLVTNALWGARGNLEGVFTAVPQRQEREGYLGDESIISQTACFGLDMSDFLTKWIRDIRSAQVLRSDGGYTDFAPWDGLLNLSYSDPGAQAGGIIFPWRLYENYGDVRMLAEHYGNRPAKPCAAGRRGRGVSRD